jgi:hypothetical protein
MDTPGSTGSPPARTGGGSTPLGPGFWLGTALAALVGAGVGVFLVLPLGLIVVEYVIFPLALFVGAVLASLTASWVGNRLAPDATRTHLLRVLGVTLAAAAVLAVLFLANAALRLVLLGPVFYVGVFSTAALALTATLSTARFRSPRAASSDARLTVMLLVLAVLSVPTVIFLAWLAGLTGA